MRKDQFDFILACIVIAVGIAVVVLATIKGHW